MRTAIAKIASKFDSRKQYVYGAGILLVFVSISVVILLLFFRGRSGETLEKAPDRVVPVRIGSSATLIASNDTVRVTFAIENNELVTGELGLELANLKTCTRDNSHETSCTWNDGTQLRILKVHTTRRIKCSRYIWVSVHFSDVLKDCFNVANSYWYGGGELFNQLWPIQNDSRPEAPFVTGDTLQNPEFFYGGVMERFWFSSRGVAIKVDDDIPLFVSLNVNNDSRLCLTGKNSAPYVNDKRSPPTMQYTVCIARSMYTVYRETFKVFLKHAVSTPEQTLFKHPIWSTWAKYHAAINQSAVTDFANQILRHSFPYSVLTIDDRWEICYGDLEFDRERFPTPRKMIEDLKSKQFEVALWVHPFHNVNCSSYAEADANGYLVHTWNGTSGNVTWWNGVAGLLDVTNPEASRWWVGRLENFRKHYEVDTFKFDAGESTWLPSNFQLSGAQRYVPNLYSTRYAELASRFGSSVEVRLGYRTQHLSLFVRMLDRYSCWDRNNGLRTIIPTVLLFGILGYPFVVPDMIGGNAYNGTRPSRFLYIRWVQVNTFLPVMQFSIPPWDYDDEVVDITRKMVLLHSLFSDRMVELARRSALEGGWPIIRPLWWIAPLDPVAQAIDTEFLVGKTLLVAPILDEGTFIRDIYLPADIWYDELRKENHTGPRWLYDYEIRLDQIAFFTRIYVSQTS